MEANKEQKKDVDNPFSSIETKFLRVGVQVIRAVAILVRDFGMPVVAFATGIWLVIGLSETVSDVYKALLAALLLLLGVLGQFWLHARENPPRVGGEVATQLDRMTSLVERLAEPRKVGRELPD